MASKPRLFVGSSVKGLSVAHAIQDNLRHSAEVTVWPQGAFELSKTTIESLIHIINSFDYGIFVFSADDVAKMRGRNKLIVRDNVIFELGLFIGKLGRYRVFIVVPEDCDKLHIPTDLLGITPGKFENIRSDNNLQAGTGSFCNQVRIAINSLGRVKENSATEDITESKIFAKTVKATADSETIESIDWEKRYLEHEYSQASSIIRSMLENEHDPKKIIELTVGLIQCELNNDFSKGTKFIADLEKNHTASNYYCIAEAYMNEGFLEKANIIIDKAIKEFNNDPYLPIARSRVLTAKGLFKEAISYLRSFDEPIDDIVIRLCDILIKQKEKYIALEVIHKAFLRKPTSELILSKFASITYDLEMHDSSMFLYDTLCRIYPKNEAYLTYRASNAIQFNLYDTAIQDYRKALGMSSNKSGWIFSNLGNVIKLTGSYEDSKNYFKESLNIEPDSSYAHNRLGELIRAQEQELKKFNEYIRTGRTIAFS